MVGHSIQKSSGGAVKQAKDSLPANSSEQLTLQNKTKIVGLSVQGILLITAVTVGSLAYGLMKEVKSMRKELASLKKENREVSRIVLDVRNSGHGVTSGELNSKLELIKNELSYKISQIKPQQNLWIKPSGEITAFDRFNQVDLEKYVIKDVENYSSYARYLRHRSKLHRDLSDHLSDIINGYASNHRITSTDRHEYLRLLEFRDRLRNDHETLVKRSYKKWKKFHRNGRFLSSSP